MEMHNKLCYYLKGQSHLFQKNTKENTEGTVTGCTTLQQQCQPSWPSERIYLQPDQNIIGLTGLTAVHKRELHRHI